ncbi:MAG: GIY-YIG nuclease family protein [Bacteroidota bacterium]
MAYYVYIIESERDGRYYIGSSHNPWLRLERHNAGWTRSTKGRGPWRLVHVEEYERKAEALRREREVKRRKSHRYIQALIEAGGRPAPK